MRFNQKNVLIVSEAILPLLGFFVWDWSVYFILLFYAFDVLAQEGTMCLKTIKIRQTQGIEGVELHWFFYTVLSLFVVCFLFLLMHFAMGSIHPKISFIHQITAFWNYEDLGVKQGYFLVPLVCLSAYQNYKMNFLMRGLHRVTSIKKLWRDHIQALLFGVGFSGLTIALSQFVIFPELVYVLAIVAGIASFNLFFKDEANVG
ncbi:MAG: hypothetical protein P8H43_09290 [Crocinitomicaceae bacterium]|nr:hypothetical protein [Crocinitomicaceae bacterium]